MLVISRVLRIEPDGFVGIGKSQTPHGIDFERLLPTIPGIGAGHVRFGVIRFQANGRVEIFNRFFRNLFTATSFEIILRIVRFYLNKRRVITISQQHRFSGCRKREQRSDNEKQQKNDTVSGKHLEPYFRETRRLTVGRVGDIARNVPLDGFVQAYDVFKIFRCALSHFTGRCEEPASQLEEECDRGDGNVQ